LIKQHWGEIKDPVHGYVYVTETEKEIIDSFPMQRLRRLRQLAGADFVYPGACHTRFEHCIGVMHLAGRVCENPNLSLNLSEEEVQMIRVATLLHDVGHGPFSHVFEHLLEKFLGKTHEDMNVWIVQESEIKDVINKFGYDPKMLAKLSVGWLHQPGKAFLDQIVRSSVDVDKMDFVVRDTFHTGAEYGYVDVFRIIHMLDIIEENLAINLGALSALESFMLARIESFRSIYFHRMGRAVQIMLALAMEKAKEELGLVSFRSPEDYIALDDYTVWTMLKKCKESKQIMANLEKRKLLKCTYDQTFYVKDKMVSSIFGNEKIRSEISDQIASLAKVDSESVVIDVPTLPSVPYRHSISLDPMEIPVFCKNREGNKIPQRLSDVSGIYNVLKGFINILRVYTREEHREKVGKASLKILGGLPSSLKISY
jgi:HD superfamily phosphohydrolase